MKSEISEIIDAIHYRDQPSRRPNDGEILDATMFPQPGTDRIGDGDAIGVLIVIFHGGSIDRDKKTIAYRWIPIIAEHELMRDCSLAM